MIVSLFAGKRRLETADRGERREPRSSGQGRSRESVQPINAESTRARLANEHTLDRAVD